MGENHTILKLRKAEKLISTNFRYSQYNHLGLPGKKKPLEYQPIDIAQQQARKTSAVADRNIVKAVKITPKTKVTDITNSFYREEVQ